MVTAVLFFFFFFSSIRRHTRCRLVTGVSDVCSSDLYGEAPSPAPRRCRGSWRRSRGSPYRSEERRVGKECNRRVDLGGRRIIKKKKKKQKAKIICKCNIDKNIQNKI